MFIGRKNELSFLSEAYKSSHAEFIAVYGRRRVGKTELITEFCKDKPNVFYSCSLKTDQFQLSSFSETLLSFSPEYSSFVNSFSDWDKAFSFISQIKCDKKFIIVIDEFPYMVKGNKSIPSILQNLWDHLLKNNNIMLIISGSSMSFMEDEILSSKNPLYGRTTGIYKLDPLPYTDAIQFVPNYSDEDKLLTYAILGGIPHYLKQFSSDLSLRQNIEQNILRRGCTLYNEVEFLLHEELREPSTYNTIISAIAIGCSEYNEIFSRTQIDKRILSVYLKNLIEIGVIRKELPALSATKELDNATKGNYIITDNFFRFWYAFSYPNYSLLEKGDFEGVWEDCIYDNLHDFASKSFEDVCIDFLYLKNKRRELPFRFSEISRWWGKITRRKENTQPVTTSEEIDIVASDSKHANFILGECKFTNAPFDLGQLKKLQSKLSLNGNIYYCLFSLNGFTDAVVEQSKNNANLFLFSANDIINIK